MPFNAPNRAVDRVFIHCSASDRPEHDDVAVMDQWHRERGWSGVGYHFFIRKDGAVQPGRDLERTPAAQAGHNTGSISVCLHGLAPQAFTRMQCESLIGLCREIHQAYGGLVTFHGHKEVANKDCPVINFREVLGLDTDGTMTFAPTAEPVTEVEPRPLAGEAPVLRVTARGDAVRRMQDLLRDAGHPLEADGIFGQVTLTAVRAFQQGAGLEVDGIVGPLTWAALRQPVAPPGTETA